VDYLCLLLLSLLTALFSVVGDLAVSLLKRMSGVKDSGAIFPGHGGMLDRMDSVASATVIFVLGALLLGL
jgi:phosphatidate cytidylyltransferase